jgi:regulator of replication initiation timing
VADGEIGPNSLDAVNGRQLYNTQKSLDHNIQQVGAGAAALANLHPLEFEHSDKVSVSAAVGNYKDQTAVAAGVYVRPDSKSLISLSGTFGNSENMLGFGFSKKFGKHSEFENMTEDQLKDALSKLSEDAKEIKEENKALHEKNKALEAGNKELSDKLAKNSKDDASLKEQVKSLSAENASLKGQLSDIQSKVSFLMEKLEAK